MTRDDAAAASPADLDWAARVQRLEAEVAGLRRAMVSRSVIEQAKGVLAERLGCSPEDAFAHLSAVSQRSNVRLADVAASVLASMAAPDATPTVPAPEQTAGEIAERSRVEPAERTGVKPAEQTGAGVADVAPDPRTAGPPDFADGVTSRREYTGRDPEPAAAVPLDFAPAYRAVASRVSVCRDPADLAATMLDCGLDPDVVTVHDAADATKPRGVAVSGHAVEVDLEAVAVDAVSDLAAAAIVSGTPNWRGEGSLRRAVALPLRNADGVFGAVVLGWLTGDARTFDPTERAYLGALGPLAQRSAAHLMLAPPTHPDAAILDMGYDPGLLLEPAYEDGRVVDFVIAYASVHVPDVAGLTRTEQIGRRLLDAYPHLRQSGAFDAYRRVWETGEPWIRGAQQETVVQDGAPTVIIVRRRAVRHGDGLLVTWHRDDDRVRRERQLQRMEALGHFGWADWDLAGKQTYWSPGMFRIFDRDPSRGPSSFGSLADLVTGDRDAVTAMVNAVNRGQAAGAEFRLARDGSERHVRVIAEPLPAGDGRVIGVLAVAQDLTETRIADERMLRVQAQLAEQRLSLAAQRDLTRELRRVLYPGLVCDVRTPGARVAGRHAAPDDDRRLRGDFCDTTLLDDGHILFAIGDSFGSGVQAGEVLARMLYPARALGNGGAAPAVVLRILNADLNRDEVPPLASIVVGRYCPIDRTVIWAQGGHLPPIKLTDTGTRILERPAGPALGLLPTAEFAQSRLPIRDGDMVVWMTDGMVFDRTRPDSDPWPNLRRSLAAARKADGLDGVLGTCRTDAAGDEACILVLTSMPDAQGAEPRRPSAPSACGSPGCAPVRS
jgi:PAS domain-containing protein